MTSSTSLAFDSSLAREYLDAIRKHVIVPLRCTSTGDHCFAAAMLIFAGVDGLGRLIHENPGARVGERLKAYLPRMGTAYQDRANELWELRNALDHNAINVACFISMTEDARSSHLELASEYLFVHTRVFLEDFDRSVQELEQEFRSDRSLLIRAESRLARTYIELPGWRDKRIQSTPPPTVTFKCIMTK